MCGMNSPFGQPRPLVEALEWATSWEGSGGKGYGFSKQDFESTVKERMSGLSKGSKYRYHLVNRRRGSSSSMMLFRLVVGKMFYQGAPRLLRSKVSVEPCRPPENEPVAIEAYPAAVARRFSGNRSYKSDEREKRVPAERAAREEPVAGLGSAALEEAHGLVVETDGSWRERFVREPAADTLDSLLRAMQATRAYTKRNDGWGVPEECDRNEVPSWTWACSAGTARRRP